MSLINLPIVIWHGILIDWIGKLPEIVCVDCALRLRSTTNPLLTVYTTTNPLPDSAHRRLARVFSWLQERRVYISQLCLEENDDPLRLHQWNDFISWSSNTLEQLSIYNCHKQPYRYDYLASWNIKLRTLRVDTEQTSWNSEYDGLETLLHSCAGSLQSLTMYQKWNGEPCEWIRDGSIYASLRALCWHRYPRNSDLCGFLYRCPNLLILSVGSYCHPADAQDVAAIADCCPMLQKLTIRFAGSLHRAIMLQFARGCPLLEYFHLYDCYGDAERALADMVCALHCLQTLVLGVVPEAVIVDIATRGHPALRVLDVDIKYTYTGLRQITAALPQLTGIAIHDMRLDPTTDYSDLLEYCGGLEKLRVIPENPRRFCERLVNPILDSVALHCSSLVSLDLSSYSTFDIDKLCCVLACCPLLSELQIPTEMRAELLQEELCGVQLMEYYIELAEFLPAWAQPVEIE